MINFLKKVNAFCSTVQTLKGDLRRTSFITVVMFNFIRGIRLVIGVAAHHPKSIELRAFFITYGE